ncbi:uncharacterized protein LOC119308014 [Triticum dicoccoides]|uniref:uncharacterized protein LOC119308014 n=1 Tax=Triticum dicoccoides TaxID=85692 RepID=UPI000E7A9289|nr:uncharacterized protein LOC119308014 [Triticum dicoccoides]
MHRVRVVHASPSSAAERGWVGKISREPWSPPVSLPSLQSLLIYYRRRRLLSVSDAATPTKITAPLVLRSREKGNSSRARRHASSEPHGGQHIDGFKAGPGRRLVSVVDGSGSALAFQRGEVGRPACVGRKGHEQEGDALEVMEKEVGGGISVHGDATPGTLLHTSTWLVRATWWPRCWSGSRADRSSRSKDLVVVHDIGLHY